VRLIFKPPADNDTDRDPDTDTDTDGVMSRFAYFINVMMLVKAYPASSQSLTGLSQS
jgi:hypothetical protein